MTQPLDQLSTSQTNHAPRSVDAFTGEIDYDHPYTEGARCPYGAPLVAYIWRGNATIKQACCNHWDCPACGSTRARQEYHRMVWGAQVLEDEQQPLYFWTITCRGRELNYDDAMAGYYKWTNILLTGARAKSKRAGHFWAYVQVTEHQKKTRAHPHSHILTTFLPTDARESMDGKHRVNYESEWFREANIRAGLGEQCRISRVDSGIAASSYIGKYLFKAVMSERWPPKWKRVRYSRNWPKPPYYPAEVAITLLTPADWKRARDEQTTWICENGRIFRAALQRMTNIVLREGDLTF